MICCDTCEDWFHGKCVGITKALGEQMEARGVEWNCPPCKKKRTEDVRKKSEEDKAKKLEEEKAKKLEEEKAKKLEEDMAKKLEEDKAKKLEEEKAKKLEEDKAEKLEEERKKLPSLKSPIKNSEIKVIKIQPQLLQKCVQCKKNIEDVAVGLFCKDICLEKHIEESVAAIKACCTSDSPDIILFDKKNSRLITGI